MADKFANFAEVLKLVESFNLSRSPPGMKLYHKKLSDMLQHYAYYKAQKADAKFMKSFEDYWVRFMNAQDMDLITSKFGGKASEPKTVAGKHGTYTKDFPGSYAKFQEAIEHIDGFLGTLTGIHGKSKQNLKVKFSNKLVLGAKYLAEYNRRTDEITINPAKLSKNGVLYGSPEYTVLHELGHRFLKYHPQKWDINDPKWDTTTYSKDNKPGVDEERFAELFAISNWPTKFPKYQTTIKDWLKQVK